MNWSGAEWLRRGLALMSEFFNRANWLWVEPEGPWFTTENEQNRVRPGQPTSFDPQPSGEFVAPSGSKNLCETWKMLGKRPASPHPLALGQVA